MSPDGVPSRARHVLFAYLDDEAVLYDPDSRRPALLNVTAAAVWAAVDGSRTAGEIAALLAVEFGGDPSVVAAGVESTLATLADLGLVEPTTRDVLDQKLHK